MAYSDDDLRNHLDQLVMTIGETIRVIDVEQGPTFIDDVDIQKPYFEQIIEDDSQSKFVGSYTPLMNPRATIAIRESLKPLNPRAWYLALLHELTHVVLHSPGSDDYDEDEYRREEPCAHSAAASICLRYGIDDYRPLMISLGVPVDWLHTEDILIVGHMTDSVWTALQLPHSVPPWALPI